LVLHGDRWNGWFCYEPHCVFVTFVGRCYGNSGRWFVAVYSRLC
jgi:hypothetical protein